MDFNHERLLDGFAEAVDESVDPMIVRVPDAIGAGLGGGKLIGSLEKKTISYLLSHLKLAGRVATSRSERFARVRRRLDPLGLKVRNKEAMEREAIEAAQPAEGGTHQTS